MGACDNSSSRRHAIERYAYKYIKTRVSRAMKNTQNYLTNSMKKKQIQFQRQQCGRK
jgi:hypothetical protein